MLPPLVSEPSLWSDFYVPYATKSELIRKNSKSELIRKKILSLRIQ